MANHYRVTITFAGTAALAIEADSIEEARAVAAKLKIEDLARQGYADVSELKISARTVHRQGAVLVNDDEEEDAGPRKPRPSGWYRPA